jgi:hypothetical protein
VKSAFRGAGKDAYAVRKRAAVLSAQVVAKKFGEYYLGRRLLIV